jgi:uncharacterized protein (DUF4415 family)
MKAEYDLSKMKRRKNPYASKLKKQITIRVGQDILDYFNELSKETGIPYQSLMNMYLRNCVVEKQKPVLTWVPDA